VLPPGLSNIAFIGQLATFQHVLTAALQVRGGDIADCEQRPLLFEH